MREMASIQIELGEVLGRAEYKFAGSKFEHWQAQQHAPAHGLKFK